MLELPVVDIGALCETGTDEETLQRKKEVGEKIDKACREWGFFYTTGHRIPQELMHAVLRLAKEFFDLPLSVKNKVAIHPGVARGFQPIGENVTNNMRDWHEGLDYYKEDLEKVPEQFANTTNEYEKNLLYGKNPWPTEPESFRSTFDVYIKELKRVGDAIMRGIALGLGLQEDFFVSKYVNEAFWYLRIIGYPSLQTVTMNDVGTSCGEHTDYGCLTLVNQDSTPGALQVLSKEGKWINADPLPGSFVTNIGDMITVWTNGVYKSTLHRVVQRNSDYRVSIPFFFEPNYDALIEPLEKFNSFDQSNGPKSYVYGKHLLSKVVKNFYS